MKARTDIFKYLGGTRTPLGREREIFRHGITNEAVIAEPDCLSAASLCREFATIEAHARRVQSRLGTAADPHERWTTLLHTAIADGLLMSAQDVRDYVLGHLADAREPCVVDRIAIPTRNRPRMLYRLLASLAGHLREWDRRIEVLVVDDSEAPEVQRANLATVRAVSGETALCVRYGNRETRRQFAEALAEESGVPPALTAFAMQGSSIYPVSTGAARNSILLETVGHGVLFMDDDVQCRFVEIPGARQLVTFQGESLSTWFFDSWDDVWQCPFRSLDLVQAHAHVLNVDRQTFDSDSPDALGMDLSRVSSRFLKAIRRGQAKVAISLMGIVGDSGWDDPFGYFLLGGETFARLTESERTYRAALQNRLILSGSRSTCVSDQCTCHSTCMGVDNGSLLPPFMPVMRGQDLVFGSLLNKCVPDMLLGSIPIAILHEPAEDRGFASDAAIARAGRLMTGETLALIARLEPIHGASTAALMRSLGARLQELRSLTPIEFRRVARAAVEPMVISCLQQLQAAIDRPAAASSFWLTDALDIRRAVLTALNRRNHAAPSDLEAAFGPCEAERHFRCLLEQFGVLLTAWPDLVSASARLHQRGMDICDLHCQS